MNSPSRPLGRFLLGLVLELSVQAQAVALEKSAAGLSSKLARVDTRDGRHLTGTLAGDSPTELRFVPEGGESPFALTAGCVVTFDATSPPPAGATTPPFLIDLGLGQRLSGRLGQVGPAEVLLEDGPDRRPVHLIRSGVRALRQRPGEVLVFQDGFESLDVSHWKIGGDPGLVGEPKLSGEHALRLPAGGSSMTYRVADPVESGRLEVAFHDDGRVHPGQRWFIDMKFRGPSGDDWARALLGWDEPTLAVQTSPAGPALSVQRLVRGHGWHRLRVEFASERTDLTVDGLALAHGHAPPGPLLEIRLASESLGPAGDPPEGLAAFVDDLRLARVVEDARGLASDPDQDEVRLVGGDQLFGTLHQADAAGVHLSVVGRETTFPWTEVAAIRFRRSSAPSREVRGLWARWEWSATPGVDPHDLDAVEGALSQIGPESFLVETPDAGTLSIPRTRLRRLVVLGRMGRRVLDGSAHHLGNNVVRDLDPPEPEGRRLELTFPLDEPPTGPTHLAVDAVQVAGEAEPLEFAAAVKDGELRTTVKVNGQAIDYLNRHITSQNEVPERLRLTIPPGVLVKGANRVEFEGVGRKVDPVDLDDIGIVGVALEVPLDESTKTPSTDPPPRR